MSEKELLRIRPAGRHLLTIGEDLIQDEFAAIIELVKNSYDADAKNSIIGFQYENNRLIIEIRDDGHGMSKDDVKYKWLVPSTAYKVNQKKSPGGRVMQGKKGIGRYAASVLGDEMKMTTTDKKGNTTSLKIRWDDYRKADYLDDVPVELFASKTNEKPGTVLRIQADKEKLKIWEADKLEGLIFELRKLIPPVFSSDMEGNFNIKIVLDEYFENLMNFKERSIIPYPILDLYDYKISGVVDCDGKAEFHYSNSNVRGELETIAFDIGKTNCGKLKIDIRVFDRDKDAIAKLVERGKKRDEAPLSKLEARKMLNEINGIGVYRNGFRIRPLGDADFDWLKLNEKRVQNPSMRIGNNQVVGYVEIESEEISGLEEKSARDGLKDNLAFQRLKEIVAMVIGKLEEKRYIFRRKTQRSSTSRKLDNELNKLVLTNLKNKVFKLVEKQVDEETFYEIQRVFESENSKQEKTIEEVRKRISIYQGQATLGKLIDIMLHEGRKPLNSLVNQIPNLEHHSMKFKYKSDTQRLDKILETSKKIKDSSKLFAKLFGKLDPLATKSQRKKRVFSIRNAVVKAVDIFEKSAEEANIRIDVNIPIEVSTYGWEEDFIAIISNLIDNSIYWIKEGKKSIKRIIIKYNGGINSWKLDYRDSGPGIESDLIEEGVIFEPEFSTKNKGMGLGLTIAGEAANRNGMKLSALESREGAFFQLTKKENAEDEKKYY